MDRLYESKDDEIIDSGLVAKTLGQDIGDMGLRGYFSAAFCYALYANCFQVSSFSLFIHLFYLNMKLFGAEGFCIHTVLSLCSQLEFPDLLRTNIKSQLPI